MNDASGGQDWATPDGFGQPSVGHAPVAPPQAAPTAPVAAPAAPGPASPLPTYRSWQPGIIPLRPVSFGEFIAVPFKALRFNRAVIIGGPLLFVGASMLLFAAALWLAVTDPSLALTSPYGQFQGIEVSTVVVSIAALLGVVLADAFSTAIVAPGVARAVLGEPISVGAALKAVGSKFGALMLLWLLSSLALLAALVPGVIVIIAGGAEGGALALGILLMFVIGIAVGVPVFIITAIARCVVVLEQQPAIASIRRTVGLIRGRFWWSVLIIGLTALLVNVAVGFLQQVMGLFGGIGLTIGISGAVFGTVIFILVTVVSAVIGYVFTYAYMGSVYALIYIDARIRHEGFDIDLARAAEARRG